MKDTCVLATAYMPSIEYFAVLKCFDKVLIERFENYPKQTYRNRCLIYSPNGSQTLTIPVSKGKSLKMHTNDISIVYKEKWHIKNWRAIETAYNNSPYFLYYKDELKNLHNNNEENLFNYNFKLIKLLCSFLNINTKKVEFTDGFIKEYPAGIEDLRERIHPKEKRLFKKNTSHKYFQVFEEKYGFLYNLSILDLLFNEGPQAEIYLNKLTNDVFK